jgi:hypothetical protein
MPRRRRQRFARIDRRFALAMPRRKQRDGAQSAFSRFEGRPGMSELIRFIALAAALGLAAGMVLGGVALLLAGPAHAHAHEPATRRAVELECVPVRVPSPPPRLET